MLGRLRRWLRDLFGSTDDEIPDTTIEGIDQPLADDEIQEVYDGDRTLEDFVADEDESASVISRDSQIDRTVRLEVGGHIHITGWEHVEYDDEAKTSQGEKVPAYYPFSSPDS